MVPSVAVAAFPVTSPVMLPTKAGAVSVPVLGLYVKSPSDSKPRFPPSTSPPGVNTIALASFVDSLSVIVTVVPTAAVVVVADEPVTFPVTFPVKLPVKAVAVSVPVLGV